jgi:hypothetical protein
MSLNEKICIPLLKVLRKIFPIDPIDTLYRKFEHMTKFSLSLEILGSTIGTGVMPMKDDRELTWIEQVDLFENIICNYIDDSKYMIILDALDADYNNLLSEEKRNIYFSLLTSLLKAVQEIKSIFPILKYKFQPIVFLRDDIYKEIKDSDMTKWQDSSIVLHWDKEKIKKMLAHRISKTLNTQSDLFFEEAWAKLFDFKYVTTMFGKHECFDTICRYTFMRPRDFIQFVKICCGNALHSRQGQITQSIFTGSLLSYSQWMRSEIESEIKEVIPDIEEIMKIISNIRKVEFRLKEFVDNYKASLVKGKIKNETDPETIFEILYQFNVVGNRTRGQTINFYLSNPQSSFNPKESIIIHKGLLKSFGV